MINCFEVMIYVCIIIAAITLPHVSALLLEKKHKTHLIKTMSIFENLCLFMTLFTVLYALRYSSSRAFMLSGAFAAGKISAAFVYARLTD